MSCGVLRSNCGVDKRLGIYVYMLSTKPFEDSSLKEILTSLIGIVGWGTLAQHTILGLYKTVLPFMGAITTIPLFMLLHLRLVQVESG